MKKVPENVETVEAQVAAIRISLEEETLSQALKTTLRQQVEKIQKDIFSMKKKAMMLQVQDSITKAKEEAANMAKTGSKKIILKVDIGSDTQVIKLAMDEIKKAAPGVAFIGISADSEKIACFAFVPDELLDAIKANEWVSKTLESCGGKGGGKPGSAQGSAPTGSESKMKSSLTAALEKALFCIS